MSTSEATFVNFIEVDPSKQTDLIELLKEGTEKVMSKRPGFISVTLLASKDGSHVINIAKWKSAADVKATQSDPVAAEYAKRTATFAKATPALYEIVGQY